MRGGVGGCLAVASLVLTSCHSRALTEAPPDAGVLSPGDAAGGTRDDAGTSRPGDAAAGRDAAGGIDAASNNDASPPPDGPTTRLARTHLLAAGPVDAKTIAADGTGVYGVTNGNALWALPLGADTPRTLVQDPGAPFTTCYQGGRLITAGDDLFWIASRALPEHGWVTALHRTSRDGASDVVVDDDLLVDGMISLAVDDSFVYWPEISNLTMGGASVRALPRSAPAGTAPIILATLPGGQEITSLAVNEQSLYWISFNAIGSTVFSGTLWTGDKLQLALGNPGAAHQLSSANAYFVATRGVDVFLAAWRDLWTIGLVRLSADGTAIGLGQLRDGSADAMVFVDGWVVVSVPASSCGDTAHRLFAAPASGGGALTLIADRSITPVALGPDGVTFVNSEKQLVAISAADLNLALSGAP